MNFMWHINAMCSVWMMNKFTSLQDDSTYTRLIDVTGRYRPLPSFPLGPSLQKEKGQALLPDHSFLAGPFDEGPPSHLVFWRDEGYRQTDTHD